MFRIAAFAAVLFAAPALAGQEKVDCHARYKAPAAYMECMRATGQATFKGNGMLRRTLPQSFNCEHEGRKFTTSNEAACQQVKVRIDLGLIEMPD